MEPKGAVNLYFCRACKKATGTINMNAGVTPLIMACRCKRDLATSVGYNIKAFMARATSRGLLVSQCWYRPTREELLTRDEAARAHVMQGGLLIGELGQVKPLQEEPPTEEVLQWLERVYAVGIG